MIKKWRIFQQYQKNNTKVPKTIKKKSKETMRNKNRKTNVYLQGKSNIQIIN